MIQEIKAGTKVHYVSGSGKKENGIVKSISSDKDRFFVVYNCGGDWDNYKDYTGCATAPEDLTYGWVDEKGELMKEFCDHHYIPTNSKWQSATQRQCINCGDTID